MSTPRKFIILVVSLMILAGSVVGLNDVFADRVSSDPRQLFYGALARNLSEKAATCSVLRTKSGTTEELTVQLDLASKLNARSVLSVSTGDTTVQTEERVVKSGNYLRYTQVRTDAKGAGNKPDFSKVLNKWIKTDGSKQPELFGLTALGGCVTPLALLPTASHASLVRQLERNTVFVADFVKSEKVKTEGRITRSYPVSIAAEPYVAFMQSVGRAAGLNNLNNIKTSEFTGRTARQAQFFVDTETGRLVKIEFLDETRTVTFKNYGRVPHIPAPAASISNKEAAALLGR